MLMLCPLALCACSLINDDLEPCVTKYQLRLTHTMNMKFSDAFAHEVKGVNVYVFDEADNLVKTYTDLDPQWEPGGYVVDLEGLEAGTYHFLAWCGDSEKGSFLQPTRGGKSDFRRHINNANDENGDYSDHNLDRLFHAAKTATLPKLENGGQHVIDMDLTKDTNNIVLLLLNADETPIKTDDFTFEITDHNSRLDHENLPETDAPDHQYRPFSISEINVKNDPNIGAYSSANIYPVGIRVEMSTSRLMAKHKPTLTVRNKYSREVISINLNDYFEQIMDGGEGTDVNSFQEYLDRQDKYNLTLLLKGDQWQKSFGIIINSWKTLPKQNTDL